MIVQEAENRFRAGLRHLECGRAREALPFIGAAIEAHEGSGDLDRGNAVYRSYQGLCLCLTRTNVRRGLHLCRQAAKDNPVLQGKYNFDPTQFERFLDGNTADENAAIKAIAHCVVAQQLAAEPAPAAIDVTLPERGTVLSFGRSVQVGSDQAMTLDIKLERASGGFSFLAIILCLVMSGIVFLKPGGSKGKKK